MKIALKNVSKSFDGLKAVANISFDVRAGEFFFLLGPSGCGKTTVLRIIAGFCVPDSGDVFFDSELVNKLPAHLRNAGMVFQNYALWPHLTVAENVAFGLTVPGRRVSKKEREGRVQKMLALLRLEGLEKRMPSQLSGGQQQRVALARSLVVNPACLLLDEPLSNLDAKLRMEMRLELRRIIKTIGITAVYVTHDQTEALAMADRCAVMRNGTLEQISAPRDLYERPVNRFVADFLGCANLIAATVNGQDSNCQRLSSAAGDWVGRSCGHRFPEGTRVTLAVRPEKIRFCAGKGDEQNVFTGIVREKIYMGAATEYRVALPGGIIVSMLQPASAGADGEVRIHVDPGDVVVLPEA